MSTAACRIPANADVVGLGIRLAIYAQNLLCFFTPFGALLDGKVTMSELDLAETQTTTNLVLAFAILISAIVQATTLGLTNYHASIILDMSWMNNTNASIYFLLYVQHKSQPTPGSGHTVEPTFSAWARHIRCSFLAAYGQGGDPSLQARDSVRDDIWIHDIANDGVTPAAALRNLVKHSVLLLGSLHLSLMAGLGVWLWSDIRGFGNMRDRAANDCAAEHAHISILGRPIPFSSGPLRIAFLTAYGLFLVPGINLLLPMVVFLGFYYCARGLAPPMIIQPGPRRMPWDMNAWERLRDSTLRSVQNSIARRWSIFPPVLGLVFLLAINLIFIIDIELTLRQNANLRGQDEFLWGFGQTLAIIPLLMPLRDISQALIVSRMRQRDLGKALGYTVMLKDWDTVHAFIARGADPNIEMRGETTAIRGACFSDRVDVVRALLDAGADPNIDPGPKRDTNTIQRENKTCLQLLIEYEDGFLDGPSALKIMTVRGWGAGVKLLLAKPGIEVNAADTNGRTPLHVAAKGSHEAVIQLLLAAPGIDVNASDTDGRTPLHVAAAEDHEVILKLLLAAPGIDVNAPDTNEWTALTWAAFKGNEAIVKDLCAVPEIIVDVAGVKRRLEHPPEGELWDNPASKDEQDKCIRVLEELSKRGRAQDG